MKHILTNKVLSNDKHPHVIGILLLAISLYISYVLTTTLEKDFRESHSQRAQDTTTVLKTKVETELKDKAWITQVFIRNNTDLLHELIENPQDEELFEQISQRLGRYFTDYYTFSIVTENNEFLIDDFDGVLGEVCLVDLNHFHAHGETTLRLHPNPVRFHYDVPVKLDYKGSMHTVLVSFDFGRISALIRNAQIENHEIYLVNKDMGYLIEATALGARNILRDRNDYRMTMEELSRVLYEAPLRGTQWTAIDLHAEHLFSEHREMTHLNGATLFSIMTLIVSLIWNALKKHHENLVHQNEELSDVNREIAHQNVTLARYSITDELTGIQNRRFFNDSSQLQWDIAQRTQTPVSLLMIDVDHFKLYNDTYGHPQGDKCLQQVARVMEETYTRSVDIVARYGGEEFVVMTTDSNYPESLHRAELLCEAVEALEMAHSASPTSDHTTISCGMVHVIPDSKLTLEELIRRADNALYEAKKAGRNRVVAYDYTSKSQISNASIDDTGFNDDSPASSSAER